MHIALDSDGSDKEDEDYTLPPSPPPFPRAARDDKAGGTCIARGGVPLPITLGETTTDVRT